MLDVGSGLTHVNEKKMLAHTSSIMDGNRTHDFVFQAVRHGWMLVRQQVRHLVGVQVAVVADDLSNHALDEQGNVQHPPC